MTFDAPVADNPQGAMTSELVIIDAPMAEDQGAMTIDAPMAKGAMTIFDLPRKSLAEIAAEFWARMFLLMFVEDNQLGVWVKGWIMLNLWERYHTK